VLEWTLAGIGSGTRVSVGGFTTVVGTATVGAFAAVATNVVVEVFDALNGDMKPVRLIERVNESSMASTCIMTKKNGK
jgi:hypothetical protein